MFLWVLRLAGGSHLLNLTLPPFFCKRTLNLGLRGCVQAVRFFSTVHPLPRPKLPLLILSTVLGAKVKGLAPAFKETNAPAQSLTFFFFLPATFGRLGQVRLSAQTGQEP